MWLTNKKSIHLRCTPLDQGKPLGKTTRPFRYDVNQIPHDYTVEVKNRFKGWDLIDSVPEELWMEGSWHGTGGSDKDHPQEKEMQKGKMVVWGGLVVLWKCCTWYVRKFGKLTIGHRTGKVQFLFQTQRKAMSKNPNYCTIALISQVRKVMLKILQDSLQQYMNHELPDAQTGFRKGRGTRIISPRSIGSSRKQSIQKNIYFCFVDYAKVFDCVNRNKL